MVIFLCVFLCVCVRPQRWCLFCTKSAYCANHKAKLAQHQSTSKCVCVWVRVSLLSQYSRAMLEIHHTTDVCTTNEYTQTSPAVNFNNALSFSNPGAFKTLGQARTYSCKFLIIDQWACLPALDNCHPRGHCVTPHSWQRAQVEKREEQSLALCPLLTLHLRVAPTFTPVSRMFCFPIPLYFRFLPYVGRIFCTIWIHFFCSKSQILVITHIT